MQSFFCSQASRQSGESLIGEARQLPIYILVEHPQPWAEKILETKEIAATLNALTEELQEAQLSPRLLLINSKYLRTNYRRVIILRQIPDFSQGYNRQELQIENLDELVPAVKACLLAASPSPVDSFGSQTRDILICTHGNYDKCCGKYGKAFYHQALEIVDSLNLKEQVQIWQSSHIGGHRFAPTAIDFPEGRYYGRLDADSFTSILTHTGDISCFQGVYRGWGILPSPLQVVERELILKYGWEWFNYPVRYQIMATHEQENSVRCQLQFKRNEGSVETFVAEVVQDTTKEMYIQGSCRNDKKSRSLPYQVKDLVRV